MYLSAKQIKELYKITSQTLYNWRRLDKIKFKKLPSGKIVYESFENNEIQAKKCVFYARVSNTKQKEDLFRQQQLLRQFMTSNGVVVDEEFSDIASGMNENRAGLNALLKLVSIGEVETVFITYKDRLVRFGFNTIKELLKLFGTNIIIINATKEEDFQQELTQDLVSIIHYFSTKMYSNRRKILRELKEQIEKNEND